MTRDLSAQEKIEEVASSYRNQGYRTIVQPTGADLPSFLQQYQPDIVAFGEHESVVIEVKHGETLVGDRKLAEIAKAVDSQEGWRFELVFSGTRKPRLPVALRTQESLTIPEIRELKDAARDLLKADQAKAALLLSWSAVEALLRLSLYSKDVQLKREQPRLLVKEAYVRGFVGWRDYQAILQALQMRTRVAHGWKIKSNPKRETRNLLNFADKLIESGPSIQNVRPRPTSRSTKTTS
jgi:hypothetical protein